MSFLQVLLLSSAPAVEPDWLSGVEYIQAPGTKDIVTTEWGKTNSSQPELVVYAPGNRDALVVLDARLSFGPLNFEWSTPPTLVRQGESEIVELIIPNESFPHPLATTYLADLHVMTRVSFDGEPGIKTMPPSLGVAWPDGADAPPVAWTVQEIQQFAPGYVLDPKLRPLPKAGIGSVRVLPPIWGTVPNDKAVAENVIRETLDIDDQRNEVAQ